MQEATEVRASHEAAAPRYLRVDRGFHHWLPTPDTLLLRTAPPHVASLSLTHSALPRTVSCAMAPARPLDADSDSDSDAGSEASVTDVQLGLSDGPIDSDDASNPLVSRIGGRPVSESASPVPFAALQCTSDSPSLSLLPGMAAYQDTAAS
jgi:hypothetical protein